METKEPNLAAFNEWICVKDLVVFPKETFAKRYNQGEKYYFHEDSHPPVRFYPEFFKLVVDETDTPIKKYVRWE